MFMYTQQAGKTLQKQILKILPSTHRFEPTVWNYARLKIFSLNGIVIAAWNTAVAPHCNTLRRACLNAPFH